YLRLLTGGVRPARHGTLKGRTPTGAKTGKVAACFARRSGPCSLCAQVLAVDDVMDLQKLGSARFDADLLQDRHEARAELVELLSRVPNLVDSELAARLEGDVVLKSIRQPVA